MTDWAWSIDGDSFDSIDGMRDIDAVAEAATKAFAAMKEGDSDVLDEETGEMVIFVGRLENAHPMSAYVSDLAIGSLLNSIDTNMCIDGRPSSIANLDDATIEAIDSLCQKLRATFDQWATEQGLQPDWQVVVKPVAVSFNFGATEEETVLNAWAAFAELLEAAE